MVLTGGDQLGVADITYIRLREEFVFLAVMLDAYSRPVIGWALDPTLEDDLTLAALPMALRSDPCKPSWCIMPSAVPRRPATTTRTCSRHTRSTAACRARPIPGTTRPASRS